MKWARMRSKVGWQATTPDFRRITIYIYEPDQNNKHFSLIAVDEKAQIVYRESRLASLEAAKTQAEEMLSVIRIWTKKESHGD